ncbi:MAG: PspC domain-containing protein [Hyphomonadaceae bacterium]
MERVVTINLNGNPYQLEEPAYDALRSYMSRAEAALGQNPDKAEIVRDLEQAIADKCSAHLSPGKTVVSAAEMTRVLEEMGPVEGDPGAEQQQTGSEPQHEPWRPARRLYRIYDHGAWTGVSAGMAAYAGIDVTWVRVFWVLSALFTGGFTALVYLVMIFAVPVASTSEELAAAHGAPFNAQEVIERAKTEYGRFAESSSANWRREERRWRRSWRQQQRAWDQNWSSGNPAAQAAMAPVQPVGYVERMFAGLFAFVFSIITAGLLIAFLIAFFSILSNGSVFGWSPPSDVPTWLVLVVLAIAYAAISSPFSALQRTSYATLNGRRSGGGTDGMATLAIVLIIGVFAWTYSSEARAFIEQGYVVIRDFVTYWSSQG